MTKQQAKQLKPGDCIILGSGPETFKGQVIGQKKSAVEIHWIGIEGSSGYVAWDDTKTWAEIKHARKEVNS